MTAPATTSAAATRWYVTTELRAMNAVSDLAAQAESAVLETAISMAHAALDVATANAANDSATPATQWTAVQSYVTRAANDITAAAQNIGITLLPVPTLGYANPMNGTNYSPLPASVYQNFQNLATAYTGATTENLAARQYLVPRYSTALTAEWPTQFYLWRQSFNSTWKNQWDTFMQQLKASNNWNIIRIVAQVYFDFKRIGVDNPRLSSDYDIAKQANTFDPSFAGYAQLINMTNGATPWIMKNYIPQNLGLINALAIVNDFAAVETTLRELQAFTAAPLPPMGVQKPAEDSTDIVRLHFASTTSGSY